MKTNKILNLNKSKLTFGGFLTPTNNHSINSSVNKIFGSNQNQTNPLLNQKYAPFMYFPFFFLKNHKII